MYRNKYFLNTARARINSINFLVFFGNMYHVPTIFLLLLLKDYHKFNDLKQHKLYSTIDLKVRSLNESQ